MIFHANLLAADDSHEISSLICYFENAAKFENCLLLQIIDWALRVKTPNTPIFTVLGHSFFDSISDFCYNIYKEGFPPNFI